MSTHPVGSNDDQDIDLSAISRNIGNAYKSLGGFIYNCIRFVRNNLVILLVLLIAGVALGTVLDRLDKVYDSELVITPNFGTADYCYSKIDLIQAKIKENDKDFLKSIGIKAPSELIFIKIEPVIDVYRFVQVSDQNFQMLKLMAENSDIKKTVEDPVTSKNYSNHKITFKTRSKVNYQDIAKPLVAYLNQNNFYGNIQKVYLSNTLRKIQANDSTIARIDAVLSKLSKNPGGSASLVYNENSQLGDVLRMKTELLAEQNNQRIDLVSIDTVVKENSSILNMKKPVPFLTKMKVILPLAFVLLFLIVTQTRKFYKNQSLRASSQTV